MPKTYKDLRTLNGYVDEFERKLKRNKSKHTVVNYLSDLNAFVNWLEKSDKSDDITKFTQDDFLDYLDELKMDYKPRSIHRKCFSLNEFLNFLNRTGRIKKAIFEDSKELGEYLPKVQKERNKTLSKGDINNLLFAASDNLMNECILRCLYDGALRVSELVDLKWEDVDVDFDRIILTVRGKGDKTRYVRLSQKSYDKLMEMKGQRKFESKFVFASDRTKTGLTTQRVNQIIKKLGKECGMDISSHIFRKTTGTRLLQKGLDVAYVSKYLGHSSVGVTVDNYLNVEEDMHDKIEKFHDEL